MNYNLYLGDLQFSSWSFRALLVAEHKGIEFNKIEIELDWPFIINKEGSITDINFDELFKEPASSCGCEDTQLFQHLDSKIRNASSQKIIPRVPLLEDIENNLLIYDTLAMSDYLDRKETDAKYKSLWPKDLERYGIIKGFVNHLHADYLLLMEEMPFSKSFRNKKLKLSNEGKYQAKCLLSLIENYKTNKSSSLFNEFGIADIMLTPFAQSFKGWNFELIEYPKVEKYFNELLDNPMIASKIQVINNFYNGMNDYDEDSAQWIAKHYRYNKNYKVIHNCRTNIIHKLENNIAEKMFELAFSKELNEDNITSIISKEYNAPFDLVRKDVSVFFKTINPKTDKSHSSKEFKYN